MRKKKSMERLACAVLAAVLAVTGAVTPVTSLAAEAEASSVAVESETPETTVQEILSPSLANDPTPAYSETTESVTESTAAAQTEAEKETVAQTTAEPVQTEVQTEATRQETTEKQTKEASVETTAEAVTKETVGTAAEAVTKEETAEAATKNETEKETIEVTTENETEEETVEVTTEDETEEETVEATTENETEEPKEELFTKLDPSTGFTEEDLAAIDFSSRRLLIATDSSVIIDEEHVLSVYNGVYLMQYETESQAKYAYAYYYGKSEFVDVDTVISVADGDNSANAAAPMAADENPIAELHEAVAGNPVKAAGAVAVIDTGVNGVANVTESVSMIGDNTADENGHGTKMAQLIAEQNPDVSILSIKALGADGTGDVSAVYAAIQYAIDKKVSVINLSMSAMGTAENAALTSVIDSAVKAGIAVVGAAGNKGMDVRFFVPGNIESAYIIGAADENGARIATSNYGATVDFNVVADSTSEAAAKFSGYYTLNGAVADEKLVFPTDYVKEDEIDFNGPEVRHQISYYDYKGSMTDLVWIGMRQAKTTLDENEEYFTTYIGYVEDAEKVKDLDVCVDFMDTYREHKITDECIVDLENMQVKIPVSYQDSAITVRWYMTNASYGYAYDVDANYMMADTPEPFKAANNSNNSIAGLNFQKAQWFQQGTFSTAFTHTPDSMNHCIGSFSANDFKSGNRFTINSGYLAIVDESNNYAATIRKIFGPSSLRWYYRPEGSNKLVSQDVNIQTFLTHFSNVTRAAGENDADTGNVTVGQDVSYLFNSVGGKGDGTIKVDTTGNGNWDSKISGSIGWVFGTCAYDYLNGQVPSFEAGGQIICTNISSSDGTAYFFYYCRSPKAQWSGGSFSITPIPDGYLRVHKSSANPTLTNGNSCYSFTNITYKIYKDSDCTNEAATVYLDQYGYSQPVKLTAGTYYIKETNAANSGYALDPDAHEVTVTAGTTKTAPQTWETTDQPLNDPFGIVINKISADGKATADLSNAYYTIKYYPKQYNSVEEIQAETDPSITPTVWLIRTLENSDGQYTARLDDTHYVKGISAGAVYGQNSMGTFIIPLGTITVQETQAPAGFTVKGATVKNAKTGSAINGSNDIYLFQLVDEKSGIYLKVGNALDTDVNNEAAMTLTYAEQKAVGGISVQKYDSATQGKPVSGTGASLAGIKYSITNMTGHSIVNYAGYTIPHGSVAEVITTDANGYAATGAYDLPEGQYIVQERRSDSTFDGQTFVDGTSDYANYWYQWDGQSSTVEIPTGSYGTVVSAGTFYDTLAYGGLYLYKYDSATGGAPAYGSGATLAGVQFAIINNNNWEIVNYDTGVNIPKGGVAAVITTDANGYAATGNRALPAGDYIVKELRAGSTVNGTTLVEGTSDFANYFYYWKDQQIQVTIEKNQAGVLTYAGTLYDDLAYGGLYVLKRDSVTKSTPVSGSGASLAGIRFAVINNNNWEVENTQTGINTPKGGVVMVIETNEDGYAATKNYALPVGDYIVRELRMDASFDGTTLTEGTSGYANYYYHWQDNRTNVSISKNDLGTLVWKQNQTFYNDLAYGGIKLQKQDSATNGAPAAGSGASLEGIKFAIVNNNDWDVENAQTGINVPKGGVVMFIETDKNGYAATGNYSLPVGSYIVRELCKDASFDGKNFVEGNSDYANYFYYWKDLRKEVTIAKNQVGTLVDAGNFKDDLAYGGLYLYKYDSATNGAPVSGTGATLAGVRFAVINNNSWDVLNTDTGVNVPKGGVVTVITTDANGYAATGNYSLPVGDYIVKELRADSTVDGTTLTEGTSEFANYSYYWKYQQLEVTIAENQTGVLTYAGTLYNDLAYGGLYLYKYDSETKDAPVSGSGASLAGIRFAVINDNNWEVRNFDTGVNVPKGGVVTVITTDANGYAATGNYALPVGDYIVKELRSDSTVDGTTLTEGSADFANYFYYWKDEQQKVTITKNQIGVLTNVGTFYNDLAYGGLYLYKYDSVTKSTPVSGSGASLAGIRFAVINNNDWEVANFDTNVNTPKGGVVMVIETNEDGYAATKNYALPVGDYIVKELRADATVDGTTLKEGTSEFANYFYYWQDNSTSVSISKNDLGTLVWNENQTFYNALAYGGIKLQKQDSATDGAPADGSGASLEGIRFAIINNNDWDVENTQTGVNVPKGGVVTVITTDANGYAATGEYALPVGKYIVKELRFSAVVNGTTVEDGSSDYANYFYYWSDLRKEVTIAKNQVGTLVDAGNFKDDLAYGGIKLQKYDSTTNGAPAEGSNVSLAGIKFAVVNNNDWNVVNHETGIVTPKGGVVMVIETDEDGIAATKEYALPVGNYIVRELRMDASFDGTTLTEGTSEYANNDYWWKDQEKSVAIEKNSIGTLVSAGTFYNVPVGGGIKLQKYDKTSGGAATGGRTLSGISFAVINNNNWSVKNYAGNLIGKGGVVQVITTDENGYAATGTHDLPLGNYIVRELRMDASFDGQQFSEGKSDYANDDYWWKEQSVTVSVTEQTAGTLIWTDPFYDSPVVTPVPTGIIITAWPYMAGMGGCILVFILLFIWRHRKKRR